MRGKVAIITGAGRGIGAATARALAARGANIVINYATSQDAAEALAQELGDCAIAVQGDVGQDKDARALAETATAKWGRIDMLVNNAGKTKFAAHENLEELEAEDFLDIYRLNVVGAWHMIRACAPAMRAAGHGSVVNIASVAGVFGHGSSVAYAASKGAMITLTKSLARVLAPAIRINAICPGYVGTGWFGDILGEAGLTALNERIAASTPLGIAASAEDIADSVVMMLDHSSRLITGETLLVDAGAHLDVGGSRRPGRELL